MSWLTFLNFHVAGEYLYFTPWPIAWRRGSGGGW
jgi:hypothetical protein